MGNQTEIFRDTLENLKSQRDSLKEQLKNINTAIDAIEKLIPTEVNKPKLKLRRRKAVPWISMIRDLFDEYNSLTIEDIQEKLSEKGVEESSTPKGRSAINTTLRRMVDDNHELVKNDETGAYSKKKKEGLTFDVQ